MSKKIVIDKETCIGCGTCNSIAPDYFDIGSDGKAINIKDYDEKDAEEIKEAKNNCPVGSIDIIDK